MFSSRRPADADRRKFLERCARLSLPALAAASGWPLRSASAAGGTDERPGCVALEPWTAGAFLESVGRAQRINPSTNAEVSRLPGVPSVARMPGVAAMPAQAPGAAAGVGDPVQAVVQELSRMPANAVPSPPQRAILRKSKLWEKGQTVTYAYLEAPNAALRSAIENAVRRWSDVTGLRLMESGSSSAHIRISFQNQGYYSFIGTDCPTARGINGTSNESTNIQPGNPDEYPYVALHELGHAIGLEHEHKRPHTIRWNESAVIAYFSQMYGWTPDQTRYQVLAPLENEWDLHMSTYDPRSIMHYWFPRSLILSAAGRESDWPTRPNRELSSCDLAYVAFRYRDAPPPREDCAGSQSGSTDRDGDRNDGTRDGGRTDGGRRKTLNPRDARRLVIGEAEDGRVTWDDPVELFRFQVREEGTYVIHVVEATSALTFDLYDGDRELRDDDPSETSTFEGPSAVRPYLETKLDRGTYYLAVRLAGRAGDGDYSVVVRKPGDRQDRSWSDRMDAVRTAQDQAASTHAEIDRLLRSLPEYGAKK